MRQEHKLTQGEIAKILNISQPQFSKIEQAQGSLTAEQFLHLIAYFNCPLDLFIPKKKTADDEEDILAKALMRWGATHLEEQNDFLVPEKYDQINQVISDVLLIYPRPAFLTNLTPVIVSHFNKINYALIGSQLQQNLGSDNRWWWILESTQQALQNRLDQGVTPRKRELLYQKIVLYIQNKIAFREKITRLTSHFSIPEDLLDETITSQGKIENLRIHRDKLAKKWRLITEIRQMDFDQALLESEN